MLEGGEREYEVWSKHAKGGNRNRQSESETCS